MSDDPRWSPVFRWRVQAPPGGWPPATTGLLDAPTPVIDGDIVEQLVQLSEQDFAHALAALDEC
jgi:hypothetical protein